VGEVSLELMRAFYRIVIEIRLEAIAGLIIIDYTNSVYRKACMPIYEYSCNDCKKRFDLHLSYKDYGRKKVRCTHCASFNVKRRLTRVRLKRSNASRLTEMPDPTSLEGLEDDPQSLGRMIRTMSREGGEDLGPEFDEVVDRLESGQSPSEIEQALPDLEDDTGTDGAGLD
jgi:putative FmdB family regulatory protein